MWPWNDSSEANRVNCVECQISLPANNWKFEHLGSHGCVFVFYAEEPQSVAETRGGKISLGIKGTTPEVSVECGRSRTETIVKNLQYIRHTNKDAAYTCLRCLNKMCRAKAKGFEKIGHEVKILADTKNIFIPPETMDSLDFNPYVVAGVGFVTGGVVSHIVARFFDAWSGQKTVGGSEGDA